MVVTEEAHQKRSQLVSEQKGAIRALEKELKKRRKDAAAAERLRAEIETLEKTHRKELRAFDVEHQLVDRKHTDHGDDDDDEDEDEAGEGTGSEGEGDGGKASLGTRGQGKGGKGGSGKKKGAEAAGLSSLPVNISWGALSKKDLEEQAMLRGLSRKGNKEDLVSRLALWSVEQKSRARAAGLDVDDAPQSAGATTVERADDGGALGGYGEGVGDLPAPQRGRGGAADDKDESGGLGISGRERDKRKKLWRRRGGGEAGTGGPGSAGGNEGKDGKKEVFHGRGRVTNGLADDDDSSSEELDEEEAERLKQYKRRDLLQAKLVQILLENPKGILLTDITTHLEKIKVKNFTPELLGYTSVEEWIEDQSKDLLHFDRKKSLIYPARDDDDLFDDSD